MNDISSKNTGLFSLLKRFGPLLLVAGLLVAGFMSGLHKELTLSNIIQQREAIEAFVSENLITALAVYMLIYIVVVAVSFPGGLPLSITSGLVFGWLVGGLATVTAATIGAIIIFLIAKSSFGSLLKDRAGGLLGKMMKGFQEDAFQYLLTLRLIPAFPFWAVNIVPGLLNMKLAPYAIATFIGIIPGTFAFTYLGAGLDSIIAEQEKANPGCAVAGTCSIDPKALITSELLIALAILAFLSFLPFIVKRLKPKSVDDENA